MIEPGRNGRRSGSVAKGRCEAGRFEENGRPLARWILFAYSVSGQGWLLIPFTGSFAAQLTLYGVARFGHEPDRGPPGQRLLGDIGLGWTLVHCPILLIAFGGVIEGIPGSDAPGLLTDLGLGLLALGLVGIVFYRLVPPIYGPPLREGAIKPAFATLGAVASVVAGFRWLV